MKSDLQLHYAPPPHTYTGLSHSQHPPSHLPICTSTCPPNTHTHTRTHMYHNYSVSPSLTPPSLCPTNTHTPLLLHLYLKHLNSTHIHTPCHGPIHTHTHTHTDTHTSQIICIPFKHIHTIIPLSYKHTHTHTLPHMCIYIFI